MTTNLFSASDFGAAFRANRLARRKTQQWVAARVGCRRQTIADLEAGKNVEFYTVLAALAALDKGLTIVDARLELDRLNELLDEPAED
ncbi:MAG: helix-turn-helix domain-containing protein [Gammaproteobacteria bacterium]|nr:helix-turn-helix domain-containing protein [Gammaproteobacteria bacterium]